MSSPEMMSLTHALTDTLDKIITCLEGLDERQLNWHLDLPETNSLYVMTVHILANAEENILKFVCDQQVEPRNRAAEFVAYGQSAQALVDRWASMRERIVAELAVVDLTRLDLIFEHPRRGPLTGREILYLVLGHASEHLGEGALTRTLALAATS